MESAVRRGRGGARVASGAPERASSTGILWRGFGPCMAWGQQSTARHSPTAVVNGPCAPQNLAPIVAQSRSSLAGLWHMCVLPLYIWLSLPVAVAVWHAPELSCPFCAQNRQLFAGIVEVVRSLNAMKAEHVAVYGHMREWQLGRYGVHSTRSSIWARSKHGILG